MQTEPKNKLQPLMIGGFVVLIVLLVWLAVQLVTVLPSTFSSLASIAESIQNYRPTTALNLAIPQSVVNSGKEFTIAWDEPRRTGTLTFSYQCTDDIVLEVIDTATGNGTTLTCGEPLRVEDSPLTLRATTDEQRFADIAYELTFTPKSGDAVSESQTITIVNASIGATTTEDDTPVATTTPPQTTDQTNEPTEPQYRVVETPIYKIPVNDPNGYTELSMSFISSGVVKNNFFHRTNELHVGDRVAVRFAVKNLGTRTSDDWDFTTELSSGFTYTAENEEPLKPNEEAVLTVVFPRTLTAGTHIFTAEITTDRDLAPANNDLRESLQVSY